MPFLVVTFCVALLAYSVYTIIKSILVSSQGGGCQGCTGCNKDGVCPHTGEKQKP